MLHKKINFIKKLFLITLIFSSVVFCDENIDYDALLLESLDEVSTIATKTKLNIDDMPAFVTILRQDKLLKLGVQDLYEALGLVPGVELSMEKTGAKKVIFRGAKEKGKISLMIDGITINNTYRGSIYHYLDFPIELVDRIEVIRGPGSVIYGSNAMVGIINIITKNTQESESSSFLKTGSYSTIKGGFNYSLKNSFASFNLDSYYHKNDKRLDAGPDLAGTAKDDERLKDYSLGIFGKKDHLNFIARYKRSDSGLFYGLGNYLTAADSNEHFINETFFTQLSYENTLSTDLDYTIDLGYNHYKQKIQTQYSPAAYGGIRYSNNYSEQSVYAKTSLHSKQFDSQDIVVGIEYKGSYALHSDLSITNMPVTNTITPDVQRQIYSIYINDQISLLKSLDVSAGFRYDHYSDFGDAYSPRVALVYQLSKDTNLKAMYSKAFRAPSWIELYSDIPGVSLGDATLQAATSDTVEAGVIHKVSSETTLKLNAYIYKISNMIYRDPTTRYYTQLGNNKFYGTELEYDGNILRSLYLNLNLSYVTGKDDQGKELTQIANILANANAQYKLSANLTGGSLLKYVGKIKREEGDTRVPLDASFVFDQSFSYKYNSIEFIASIKNLFDEKVKYISEQNTYPNDLEREGRSYWINALWNF